MKLVQLRYMRTCVSIILLSFFLSCSNSKNEKIYVDFSETKTEGQDNTNNNNKAIHIAIASMTSPKETYIYYNDLVNYLSDKIDDPIYTKQKKTYNEVNSLLENSEIDFAFICSGAFVCEYKKDKIKLLVAPQINGKTHYNAYIIANRQTNIRKFKDFKNRKFAFTDPLSNTGRLYPLKELKKSGNIEENFFSKSVYTYGHDISIQMVNRGIVDGASVHGLIYDYIQQHYPEKVKNVKIIGKSENFGAPPIVTPISLDSNQFAKYQDIFLNIHKDSIGKSILNKLKIDKFIVVEDTIYKSVFELKEYIGDE